jgi:LCP family protein required for cell wall assembly
VSRDSTRGEPLFSDDDALLDELDEEDYGEAESGAVARRRSRTGVVIGLVLGVALSMGAILAAASVSRAGGLSGGALTILVLGTDQRPGERGSDPGRTDSMLLISVSRVGGDVAVVSIPRDLWVPIPGYGESRVNAVYRAGELDRPGSGAALAKRTIGDVLGVPIDRYVLVDMTGVRGIVDRLGGIDVDVPETIVDDQYPTDDYGTKSVRIPAGRQHLNGDLALAYARTRHQDSDFGRMARQQQVIAAIVSEVKSPSSAPRLPAIMQVLQQSTQTDLRAVDYASLGPAAVGLSDNRVRRLVIGPDLVTPLTGADGAALLRPSAGLRAAVASFLAGSSATS